MTGLSGAVLAGGRSSRFGSDKARFLWRGKPLAVHVLDSLDACDERFLVADRPYPEFGVPVVPDLRPVGAAIAGVHSALAHARYDWVAVAACDLPYLTKTYWRALWAQREGAQAVAVTRGGYAEPLAALYHQGMLPRLEQHLDSGHFSLQAVLSGASVRLVALRRLGLPETTLLNLNTGADANRL